MRIPFSKTAQFLGRNGKFSASGLGIYPETDRIVLLPITSKARMGRCEIEIPKEDLQTIIIALQRLL